MLRCRQSVIYRSAGSVCLRTEAVGWGPDTERMESKNSRRALKIAAGVLLLAAASVPWRGVAAPSVCEAQGPQWPAWQAFAERFVAPEGRVVDITFQQKSTSEGQAYGLFFALVADDRTRFDRILAWTSDHLAGGQLGPRLPAWLWAQDETGRWRVGDRNSAADADLWMAYVLLEAGRIWSDDRYTRIGQQLMGQIARHEIVDSGTAGRVLMPAPYGFDLGGGRLRLLTSYLPGFLFARLAAEQPDGPWQEVWESFLGLAPQVLSAGVAPDVFELDRSGRVWPDSRARPGGSYDAIRVYLWAGMWPQGNAELLQRLKPFAGLIKAHGAPPEIVDPETGKARLGNASPIGFSGAVLPFLQSLGERALLLEQRERLRTHPQGVAGGEDTHYYDQVLMLFGQGWSDGQFSFDATGHIQAGALKARRACVSPSKTDAYVRYPTEASWQGSSNRPLMNSSDKAMNLVCKPSLVWYAPALSAQR